MQRSDPSPESRRPRRLTDAELAQLAGHGGVGLSGYGALVGELTVDEDDACSSPMVHLITADRGGRGEVRFTIDAATARVDLLPGHRVRVFGLIHKTSDRVGTIRRAQIVHDCHDAQLLPGMHVELAGVVDERGDAGLPGGSWLVLDQALHLAGGLFQAVHLEHRRFAGADLRAHGRLELRRAGGIEGPAQRYAALDGVTDIGAGEPRFDGVQFHSAVNGAHLRVLVLRRPDLFDAPATIVVLDAPGRRGFLGSVPFHGFTASAPIEPANDEARAAVRFDDLGNALDAATHQPLLFLDREAPPPDVVDGLTTAWFFDPARLVIYGFISGGVAGFMNRMATVLEFSREPA